MEHEIKMIGLDLDGTLLNSQKELNAYTQNVLQKAIEQGVVVLPATGRPVSAISEELLSVPGIRYAVTANGARILDLETGKVLWASTVSVETAEALLQILSEYDTILEIFVEGKGYTQDDKLKEVYDYFKESSMAEYLLKTRTQVADVKAVLLEKRIPVDKVQGFFRNMEERKEAWNRIKEIQGITVTDALGTNLEINKEGIDKGEGLLKLGELLGIKQEEIMACGDGMNDYEMLKKVGFGVAMENGTAELKEIADYVTDTNDDNGVAKAIEKFVLKEKGEKICLKC